MRAALPLSCYQGHTAHGVAPLCTKQSLCRCCTTAALTELLFNTTGLPLIYFLGEAKNPPGWAPV